MKGINEIAISRSNGIFPDMRPVIIRIAIQGIQRIVTKESEYSNHPFKVRNSMTMPKFTSQILLLFSKVLHILEKLLLKNFTGLKVVS